jgi:uncharacterized membrane protein YbaN (DUF454 family)
MIIEASLCFFQSSHRFAIWFFQQMYHMLHNNSFHPHRNSDQLGDNLLQFFYNNYSL